MDKVWIFTVLAVILIASEVSCQPRRRRPDGRRTSPTAIQVGESFQNGDLSSCTSTVVCTDAELNSPYRTITGKCNNRQNHARGSATIAMRRFLPAEYDNNMEATPRIRGINNELLPDARTISRAVHTLADADQDDAEYTHMVMQWGQFLDHDLTLTPIQARLNADNSTTRYICCPDDFTEDSTAVNIENDLSICHPIPVQPDDPSFANRSCIDFVRSIRGPNAVCKDNPPEQLNDITAFIDASNVYGSTEDQLMELSNIQDGTLKEYNGLLPVNGDTNVCDTSNGAHCFLAGDERANEQPALSSLHTIWVWYHNKVAKELKNLNSHWDGKKVFDETRKIVAALMQKITVFDFLPVVLGRRYSDYLPKPKDRQDISDHRDFYNRAVDPGIMNSFATAAYRFGHSLIRNTFSRKTSDYQTENEDALSLLFGRVDMLQSDKNNVAALLRGMTGDKAKQGDQYLNSEVTENLFREDLDLAALNIQRGRDHGLPPYLKFRAACNLQTSNSFTSLHDIKDETAFMLDDVYSDPRDIDLFTGGLAERRVPEGLVGETFACIIGSQFWNLISGDRYWFERKEPEGFRSDQLAEIRKMTLAGVLCDVTGDTTRTIQPNVFRLSTSPSNGLVSCGNIPSLQLSKWQERNQNQQQQQGGGRRGRGK